VPGNFSKILRYELPGIFKMPGNCSKRDFTQLSVAEDNIPTEKQCLRSDEFWSGVLNTVKHLLEN
jgi:hypothetical protein